MAKKDSQGSEDPSSREPTGTRLVAEADGHRGRPLASQTAAGRSATVAVEAMTFRKVLSCAWVLRRNQLPWIQATEGKFVYVAQGDDRRPRNIAGD